MTDIIISAEDNGRFRVRSVSADGDDWLTEIVADDPLATYTDVVLDGRFLNDVLDRARADGINTA